MHHLEWKSTSLVGDVLAVAAGSAAKWLHMARWRARSLGGSNKKWCHWVAANFVNAPWKTSSGFLDGSLWAFPIWNTRSWFWQSRNESVYSLFPTDNMVPRMKLKKVAQKVAFSWMYFADKNFKSNWHKVWPLFNNRFISFTNFYISLNFKELSNLKAEFSKTAFMAFFKEKSSLVFTSKACKLRIQLEQGWWFAKSWESLNKPFVLIT